MNFALNRRLVFGADGAVGGPFRRYLLLCLAIMLLSAAGTWGLSAVGVGSSIAKVVVDAALCLVSYRAQARWVFAGDGRASHRGGRPGARSRMDG